MTILTLDLELETPINSACGLAADGPKQFRERQTDEEPEGRSKKFDWAFGVLIPLICVAADPIVFRSAQMGSPLLGAYRPFAYLLSFASILSMAAWLLWGEKLKWIAAPMSGLFYVGGVISLLVGIVLIPFSIIGIMFYFVGLLGFTPLLAGIVYLRNAGQAYRTSLITLGDQAAWQAAFLAGLFSVVVPYVINVQLAQAVQEVATGDVNTIRRGAAKLKFAAPLVDLSPVTKQYRRIEETEKDSPSAKEVAHAYKEITGMDIENAPSDWD